MPAPKATATFAVPFGDFDFSKWAQSHGLDMKLEQAPDINAHRLTLTGDADAITAFERELGWKREEAPNASVTH